MGPGRGLHSPVPSPLPQAGHVVTRAQTNVTTRTGAVAFTPCPAPRRHGPAYHRAWRVARQRSDTPPLCSCHRRGPSRSWPIAPRSWPGVGRPVSLVAWRPRGQPGPAPGSRRVHTGFAQFIALCSSHILAEMRCDAASCASKSRIHRCASSRRMPRHRDALHLSTNSEKLRDLYLPDTVNPRIGKGE